VTEKTTKERTRSSGRECYQDLPDTNKVAAFWKIRSAPWLVSVEAERERELSGPCAGVTSWI
jgi:hypothetical protein